MIHFFDEHNVTMILGTLVDIVESNVVFYAAVSELGVKLKRSGSNTSQILLLLKKIKNMRL